ncbi:omptin family outer membrane protease [Desulfoluna sp.]|uniref:omptin family outer membrane protease n=1 Tax=Desulfoluna sp. TaxID=2045199 RepID=UPI00260B9114|nr:omptin family outer membrane protease [Desulfoluna sp.]
MPCQAVAAAVSPTQRVEWFSSSHHSLSMSLNAGIVNGESHEIVYGDVGEKVSELIWRLENVPVVGLSASIPLPYEATLSLSAWSRVGRASSLGDDYDWLSEQHPTDWSDYSVSPTVLTDGEMADVQLRIPFFKQETWGMSGLVGFRYDHWGWEDHGGTFIYSSPEGFRDQHGNFENIPGIAFEQWMYAPYLGFCAHLKVRDLTLTGSFAKSNWAWAKDEDHHLLRGMVSQETFDNIRYQMVALGLSYPLTTHLALSSNLRILKYSRTTGDISVAIAEGTFRFPDQAGLQHSSWMGSVSLVYGF